MNQRHGVVGKRLQPCFVEGNGLDSETAMECSERITIKMSGNAESLNAAMAAGIIMWELMRFD